MGRLHTVNPPLLTVNDTDTYQTIDMPLELSRTYNRMIRQGQSFKIEGIDMTLSTQGTLGGGQISGYIRYMAPTKGRVQAYRDAFKAVKSAMKIQGVSTAGNKQYDFRVGFNANDYPKLINQATLGETNDDGDSLGLYLTYPLEDASGDEIGQSIFEVYNNNINPAGTGVNTANLFSHGYGTFGTQSSPTDFVLRDDLQFSGNPLAADTGWDYIPFTLSWTPDTTDQAVSFNWRPVGDKYLSVMCGMLQIRVEEVNLDGNAPAIELSTAVHTSGWSSIMSDKKPRKKSRKSKK